LSQFLFASVLTLALAHVVSTPDAIKLINDHYNDMSDATPREMEVLKAFSRVVLKRAEEDNDVEAQVLLGIVFSKDSDSTRDSLSWFMKAAEQKNSFAEYAVGIILLTGSKFPRKFIPKSNPRSPFGSPCRKHE
jgi:TPR repeat protein